MRTLRTCLCIFVFVSIFQCSHSIRAESGLQIFFFFLGEGGGGGFNLEKQLFEILDYWVIYVIEK